MAGRPRDNLIGKRFDRITVTEFSHIAPSHQLMWKYRCDCGTEKVTSAGNLRRGGVKSCGCWRREINLRRKAEAGNG
jgi:hypothetical protein